MVSRERVGYFVNAEMLGGAAPAERAPDPAADSWAADNWAADNWNPPDWRRRLRIRPSEQSRIQKPRNWRRYP